jgi:hypothetical protein
VPIAVTGALNVQLAFDTISVTEVAYTLTRSGSPQRQGKFIVDGQSRLRGVVGPLAPGADYLITLQADARWRDTGASTSCTASNAFSITAGQTTALVLMLRCGAPPPPPAAGNTGNTGNMCPVIMAIRAIPSEAPLGTDVVLKVDVTDADEGPQRLRYTWSADSGAFTDAASARAGFQCTVPGIATVSLITSDGDPACSKDPVLVYVTCLEADVASGQPVVAGRGAGAAAGSIAGAAGSNGAGRAGASVAGSSGSAGQVAAAGAAGGGGNSGSRVAALSSTGGAADSGGSGGSGQAGPSGVLRRLLRSFRN